MPKPFIRTVYTKKTFALTRSFGASVFVIESIRSSIRIHFMTDHLLYRFFFFTVIQVLAFTPFLEFFANNRILNLPLNFF